MNIKVCVGSSCHLKGSYDVILAMKDILKKYDVEDHLQYRQADGNFIIEIVLKRLFEGTPIGCALFVLLQTNVNRAILLFPVPSQQRSNPLSVEP